MRLQLCTVYNVRSLSIPSIDGIRNFAGFLHNSENDNWWPSRSKTARRKTASSTYDVSRDLIL